MRALLVDDEPLARDGLRWMLAAHPDVEVVGEAGTGSDALSLAVATRPDLLLIDVQMPEMTGLELAAALPDRSAAVVFFTAHPIYAVQAFEVHALDYLLKPVDDRRLADALDRARAHVLRGPTGSRLAVRDRSRIVYLAEDDIDWIRAADYYVELHVGGKEYLHREPLHQLERRLGDRFVRIHRSILVNRERIREVHRDAMGEVHVVLADATTLRVARACRGRVAPPR
ncbi:MAG: LytTR family DNA-binding domain-containing protein [Myxococcota bacterium]